MRPSVAVCSSPSSGSLLFTTGSSLLGSALLISADSSGLSSNHVNAETFCFTGSIGSSPSSITTEVSAAPNSKPPAAAAPAAKAASLASFSFCFLLFARLRFLPALVYSSGLFSFSRSRSSSSMTINAVEAAASSTVSVAGISSICSWVILNTSKSSDLAARGFIAISIKRAFLRCSYLYLLFTSFRFRTGSVKNEQIMLKSVPHCRNAV
mmetsp:Transcript_36768/g.42758  ORF Transcript_36768/g.42758 Transcript_36768/m.42758 type:complete len:210 (-) Transcript_36768:355-984(-)